MRKKDHQTANNHHLTNKQFVIAAAFKHFERDRIDTTVLTNFNSLIHSITLRLLRSNNEPQAIEIFKIANQLIIGFTANLSEQTYRHTCTSEDIIQLFVVIANYFQKSTTTFGNCDIIIQSNLVNIFWPLFEKPVESSKTIETAKVQLINNMIQTIEEYKRDNMPFITVVKETFASVNFGHKKGQSLVKEYLIAFLRSVAPVSNLKPILLKYLTTVISENHEVNFKKALKIYEHMGVSFQDRRETLQDLLFKTLDFNNCIPFVMHINQCFHLSKLIKSGNLPYVILRMVQKIFTKNNVTPACLKVLQELSSMNITDFQKMNVQKVASKGQNLVIKFLEWIIGRYSKRQQIQSMQAQALQLKEKMMQQAEFKEQKLIEFVKKLSHKNSEGNEGERNSELITICSHFSNFVKNIIRYPFFYQKISIKDIDSITLFKNNEKILSNPNVKEFICSIFPSIIQEFTINPKDKNPLKYAIMLRKVEIQAEKCSRQSQSLESLFKQTFYQMIQTESLNYHFVICFILLKYEKQRDGMRDIIVDSIIADLKKQGTNKNSRNLLLNLSLILKSYDHLCLSQPLRFKVKQVIKNSDLLATKLEINHLIGVQPKEYTNLKHNNAKFQPKIEEMKYLLNRELANYSNKEHLNLIYSLTIAVNDLIENSGNTDNENTLLTQITQLRRHAILGELYTNIHLINEGIDIICASNQFAHPKKIEVFLLLLKIKYLTKNNPIKENEDSELLFQKLQTFMLHINLNLNHDLLSQLENLKSNPNMYSSQPFQTYLEEKQIIKFYAEATKDIYQTHVILSKVSQTIFQKLMEMKKITYNDLSDQLKNLSLLYSTVQDLKVYGYTSQQEQQLLTYIMVLLLNQKIKEGLSFQILLKKLLLNASHLPKLFLQKNETNIFKQFMSGYPVDFITICLTAVKKTLISAQKDDLALFELVRVAIDEDNKSSNSLEHIIMQRLRNSFEGNICELIFQRAKKAIQLESKTVYFKNSELLYKLISKSIDINKNNLLQLVQSLVQLDCYNSSDQSGFILKETSLIFAHLQEKSSQICQTIFNYILTLTDIFKGDQKLQISTFICSFFGLEISVSQEINYQNFQKKVSHACSNSPNYKCLKCDEKKIICYSCAVTCHQSHPACFLNIPVQLKFAKCLCSDIGGNSCKLYKENLKTNVFKPPKNDFAMIALSGQKPIVNPNINPPPEFFERMRVVGGSFIPRNPRDQLYQPPIPSDRLQLQTLLREEEMLQQQMRSSQWYDAFRDRERDRERDRQRREDRQEFFPRMGGRLQRIFDREQVQQGGYKMFIQPNEIRRPNKNIFNNIQKEKQEASPQEPEPQFIDENYESIGEDRAEQCSMENQQGNTILKKYVLLPKFIDLMVSFCSKKSDKDKITTNYDLWKLSFTAPQVSKILPALTFKLHNNANFSFQIRKENAIHNMSCVLIKKNIAQNSKFLLLASSTQIFVFSKEKILSCVAEMKLASGYNSISRHSISFEVHSMEFSPSDPTLFCVSGLHNLSLMNINSEGHIARTSFRYNVSNFYINKIKLAKMGIFVGIDKEIRVLNYTCRHFLTIKAQQSNTIIREWTIFQKAAGCQILFVCPNGNIFTSDVMPTDEGKKQFVSRVTDHRSNKTGTGASIFAKDIPEFGKYLFASFKDGSNILGHLQGDQLEDMVNLQLKGIKFQKNIFDTNFIVGHADLVKLPQIDEVYLICTVKKYFPPELSFHQGFLIAVRFKKDGSSEIIILNDQVNCEYFQVVRVGKRNFFVYSVHTDGSIQISTPNKLAKANIQEEIGLIKQSQDLDCPIQNGDFAEGGQNNTVVRKLIEKQLKLDAIISRQTNVTTCSFRQGSDILKPGTDYSLIKHNTTQFQFKQTNFSKILTGFSVPYFGDVILPTRKLKNVFQVGLTQLQALYFFSQGSLKFKYIRNEQQKYTRESFFNPNAHPRMLQRIERIERLSQYHDGEKLLNSHIMNTILGFKEDTNSDLMFSGKTFELFRAKILKFEQMFRMESDDESSSIEKTALIIKMFLTKSLKDGNPCGEEELLQLIEAIKTIVPSSSKRLFNLLRDIIVLAVSVYEKQSGKFFTVNDQNYALRAATENRVLHYFKILKLDINDAELNEFLNLLCQLIKSDEQLMAYYVAKYSGIFIQIHRRLKKADSEQRAIALIELYSFSYPILKFCEVPCSWMLGCICSTTYAYLSSKIVRERLYSSIQRSKRIVFQNWLKSLCNSDGIVEEVELANSGGRQPLMDEPKDQMMEIYNMFNRGQIDEETLFKMISEASKLEYEREQENQMGGSDKNLEILPQLEQQMEIQSIGNNYNSALVIDLIDECTDIFSDNADLTNSRVMVLYVLGRAVDDFFEDCTNHILKRIKKMVNQIDLKSQGEKLNSIIGFSCLFNRILINSTFLKRNGGKANQLYSEIETEVNSKLSNIRLETVPKLKNPPNVLGKIFRGEKTTYNIHIAYALTCLLLFPCEPSHVLLSLQCYWLLPESKEFYSKQKDFSNITDGIESGNIQKVYEIAKSNPKIWQQYSKLEFVERWIEEKRHNWELALELIAIYYQD